MFHSLPLRPIRSHSLVRQTRIKEKERKNSLLFVLLIIIYLFIQHIAVANGRNFLSSSPNCFTLIGLCRRLSAACSHSGDFCVCLCAQFVFFVDQFIFRRTRFNFGKGNRHTNRQDRSRRRAKKENIKKSFSRFVFDGQKKNPIPSLFRLLCVAYENRRTQVADEERK